MTTLCPPFLLNRYESDCLAFHSLPRGCSSRDRCSLPANPELAGYSVSCGRYGFQRGAGGACGTWKESGWRRPGRSRCRGSLLAMGMGDLKLFAAVGAWIGFTQLGVALVMTAMAGGAMGILWTMRHHASGEVFDGAGDLLFGWRRRGFAAHHAVTLDNPLGHKMPYAPAIAIGTLFSFFC